MNRRVPNVMLSTSRNWFLTILHFYLRQHVLRFMFIGWLVRSFVNMCWGQMSWKRLEIEAWLQWSTYRKWHTTNGMVALSMMSRDPLWAGGVSLTWRRLRPLTAFYSSSRYVPNVAKRSIWDQCKKRYILTTDRPTDRPLIWPILGKFHMAISPRGVVRWSTFVPPGKRPPGGVFGVGGSNGSISGLTKFSGRKQRSRSIAIGHNLKYFLYIDLFMSPLGDIYAFASWQNRHFGGVFRP